VASAIEALGLPLESTRIEVPGGAIEQLCRPPDAAGLGELVRAAAQDGAGLLPIGGGTRLGWAHPTKALALGVSLDRLAGLLEFEPDEGVMRVGAGMRLVELRTLAAAEGWELPLDSPGEAATVGGTIATAVMGPRAHAFGPVKDAILGLDVVGGEGVATRCGGRVVKNVTGYDLAKLYCGSFGSLAIVTAAWLRLRPAPARREVACLELPASRESLEALQTFATRPSVRALIWERQAGSGGARVWIELGGSSESVDADRAALAARFVLEEATIEQVDEARDARARPTSPFALRARVLGSHLYEMAEIAAAFGLDVSIDVGLGVVHAVGSISDPERVERIRGRAQHYGGSLRVEAMPRGDEGRVDVFGDLGGVEPIVASLKRRFDPAGILSPGRFIPDATERQTR